MRVGQTIGSALDGPGGSPEGHRFVGADGSGRVRVETDPDVARPRVRLGTGWRSTVRPEGLGPAVLQAFADATLARLVAFASADSRTIAPGTKAAGPAAAGAPPAGAQGVDLVLPAHADLAEFRSRLAALSAGSRTVSSVDQRVAVTVRGGTVVAIDIGRAWREQASDEDLERHLDEGMRAALALIATTPQQALDGCPYLLALLATTPAAPPFTLPEPAHSPPLRPVPAPPGGPDPWADPDRPVWSPPAGWNATSARSPARPSAPTNLDW